MGIEETDMRGKKAKALRKYIYGDKSLKMEREYMMAGKTLINAGHRGEYQLAKHPKRMGLLFEVNG